MEKLFRREVLESKSQVWMGAVTFQRPFPMKIAALTSLFILIGFIYILFCKPITRSVTVEGWLATSPGLVTITTATSGFVVFENGKVGEKVEKGEVLLELSSTRAAHNININVQAESSLQQRMNAIRASANAQKHQITAALSAFPERTAAVNAEILNIEAEILLKKAKLTDSSALLDKYEYLRASGHVSDLQMIQLRSGHAETLSDIKRLERERMAAQRERLKLSNEMDSMNDQLAINEAQLQGAVEELNMLALEQAAKSSSQIVAPVAGVIASLGQDINQSVNAGAIIATILPKNSTMVARLNIPSRAIGHVKVGNIVRLRLAAFPFEKFGYLQGRLAMIERSPAPTDEMVPKSGDNLYRAEVRLEKNAKFEKSLRAGMTLRADINQGSRPLGYWLFAPLFTNKSII